MTQPLAGRTAIVTGGSRGLGFAIASQMKAAGADVAIAVRHPVQLAAAERLGLSIAVGDDYDVVIDAAGSASGLETATEPEPGA